MKLDLNDLKPSECSFELSGSPGKQYTLKKFSLLAQIWMRDRFGADKVEGIFKSSQLPEICETVHYLLKDKTDFPTFEDLAEAICTQDDRKALLKALLTTIGVSQPIMKQIAAELDEKKSLSLPIGETSTIPLQANTDTPSTNS